MTAEKLYKEFLAITHFDESKISNYYKIKNIKIDGECAASGFDGLMIELTKTDYYRQHCIITYFHDPRLENKNV